MTTREAFGNMIQETGVHIKLGITDSTARGLRKRFLDGKLISLDKMEELLERAGYIVVQEKKWVDAETK